jgi:hypothetical protein
VYFEKTCLPSIDRLTQRSWSQRVKKSDKTWSVSYGLAHPDRTVPHRTTLSGSLVVRSWFALGSLMVLLRYGTVTVRYFKFFLTGTVHVYVHLPRPRLEAGTPVFICNLILKELIRKWNSVWMTLTSLLSDARCKLQRPRVSPRPPHT